MIRDLYDNSIVAYKTASRQTVNLVLGTILWSYSSTATRAFNIPRMDILS